MSGPERASGGRAFARWPRSISTCGCWASGPTASTSCAPSFRPSRWPTSSDIAFAPGRRTDVVLEDDAGHPRQPGGARGAAGAGGHARHRARGDAAAQAHSHGRRAGRRVFRRGGGSAGASGPGWRTAEPRGTHRAWRRSWAATFRFFCWAARRWASAAEPSCSRCPMRRAWPAVLVAPGIHVDTPGAYAALSPCLTTESQQNKIVSFQTHVWDLGSGKLAGNDFETVVFERHGRLRGAEEGACPRGSVVCHDDGQRFRPVRIVSRREGASRAWRRLAGGSGLLTEEKAYRVSLVGRASYRSMWRRALAGHTIPGIWPPRSRYLQ